jgi:hypothetical protein
MNHRTPTLWIALFLVGQPVIPCDGAENPEVAVKSALVLSFARFSEWPEAAKGAARTLVIGVMGSPELAAAMGRLAAQKSTGRPLQIRTVKTPAEGLACQVLFLGQLPKALLQETVAAAKGYPVLTISEHDQALQLGAVIQLVEIDGRILFEVSLNAMRDSRLTISAKLLKLAKAARGKGR